MNKVPETCQFGQLNDGDTFFYHDQLYRKEGELSALLIRWSKDGPQIAEPISHRFYPEIVVQLPVNADQAK